jgi:hypothetical protein
LSALGEAVLRGAQAFADAPHLFGIPIIFNLPAFTIVGIITVVLVIGIRESAWFNTSMVALKLVIIAFFIVFGAFFVRAAELAPFAPNGTLGISPPPRSFSSRTSASTPSLLPRGGEEIKRDMPVAIIAEPGGVRSSTSGRDRSDRHGASESRCWGPADRSRLRSPSAALMWPTLIVTGCRVHQPRRC